MRNETTVKFDLMEMVAQNETKADDSTIYYLKGFYLEGSQPEGACKISEDTYRLLLEGQAKGKQIVTGQDGLPVLIDPQPSPYHELQGEAWVISSENETKQLADAKTRKLNEINQKAQAFVNSVAKLDETPEFEQATWQEQANEARAWFADKSTPTPKLALLATLRGVPLDVLRQKCYEKAQAFYQLSFAVAGQRQRYEDQLKQAGTLAEISAISPEFSLEVTNG